jgi:hypothetical protein
MIKTPPAIQRTNRGLNLLSTAPVHFGLTSLRSPAIMTGAATWRQIMAAVTQLANKTPGPVH